jgi:hypothetical protein
MEMKKIPENSVVGHEEELEALDRLWNTLKMILFKARLSPAYVRNVLPIVALGLKLGLINDEEAQWLVNNSWWITPQEPIGTDPFTVSLT